MASHEDEKDLPLVWPFLLSGVLILVALCYFCLGFAIKDVGDKLPAHFTVFWVLIAVAGVMIIVTAIYNISNEYARQRRLGA